MIPKFRYFNKLTKEMCASDFCVTSDGRVIDTYNINSPEDMENVAVLMQYTGLKDIKGAWIVEGDIVKTTHPYFDKENKLKYSYKVGLVVFDHSSWKIRWSSHDVYIDELQKLSLSPVVVGNIYENPELLEE